MKVFFGSAIQGAPERGLRREINSRIISLIKERGHTVLAEHTTGRDVAEVAELLEAAIGPLPPQGIERIRHVRDKMVGALESDLDAAVFEVSLPSTGTGIEVAHAYLRPRMGLPDVPILLLYQKEYWKSGLSTMVRGLPFDQLSNVELHDYEDQSELDGLISDFLGRFEQL